MVGLPGKTPLAAQGRGHAKENERPTPFDGAVDFVSRFLVEQFVTFPKFVFSGQLFRNWAAPRASPENKSHQKARSTLASVIEQ